MTMSKLEVLLIGAHVSEEGLEFQVPNFKEIS